MTTLIPSSTYLLLSAIAALVLFSQTSLALEPVAGAFTASKSCPALLSTKKKTNPGNIMLERGRSYETLGLNRVGGDKLLIKIPNAPKSSQRWVALACGQLTGTAAKSATPKPSSEKPKATSKSLESKNNVLALNWQSSFCEDLPHINECRQLNKGRLKQAARELTLHGLWPQPRANEYCGISQSLKAQDTPSNWRRLPDPKLTRRTERSLETAMPGYQSHLHKHEWLKHGSCYKAGGGAEEYFDDALYLLDEINSSQVGRFFRDNVGHKVSANGIRAAFDAAFGKGAGKRVEIKCARDGQRKLITEIWVRLYGTISRDTPIADLIQAARPARKSCNGGILDRAGLQ